MVKITKADFNKMKYRGWEKDQHDWNGFNPNRYTEAQLFDKLEKRSLNGLFSKSSRDRITTPFTPRLVEHGGY